MNEQNEIAVSDQAGFLAPVVSMEDALAAYQAKKNLIEKIMKPEVDYGVIPGTGKPTLLKAGAEKATSLFGLHPVFKDAEIVEDWTGENHGGEPFFYYRRTCNLYKGNVLIASVDGSANSWEKKHRYRWVEESKVPSTIDKAQLKTQDGKISEFAFAVEKAETTGKYGKPKEYWQMFKDAIASGQAVKFQRPTKQGFSDAWEIGGTLYCLPNEDPADLANTLLKMADKRALVAATLIATGMSEYFTQDIEDYIDPTKPIEGHFDDITPVKSQVNAKPKPSNVAVIEPNSSDIHDSEQGDSEQKKLSITDPETWPEDLMWAFQTLSNDGEAYGMMATKDLVARANNPKTEPDKIKAAQAILKWRNEQKA